MINTQQAIAFVRAEGNGVELARLALLRDGKRPSADILAQFSSSQQPDGGWSPFWAADYSSLDATCYHLTQLDQLGADASEIVVRRALDFLQRRQRTDGTWEEETAISEQAPPWAKPGDLAARLYLTANCGFWLARFGHVETAVPATAHLHNAQEPSGKLPSFLQTNWLAAALWHLNNRPTATAASLDYLATQLGKLSANNLTWLLTTFQSAQMDNSHEFVQAAQTRLAGMQEENGRFPSDDMMERDVHVTLEALRVFSIR
ncbi:MAG: prenyltransferase/squalene oxidase repeat-containing protein [Chloroflexota bacterium]